MKKRMLRDIKVSEVGMGCMAFSHEDSRRTIQYRSDPECL